MGSVITKYGVDTVLKMSLLAAIILTVVMVALRNDVLKFTIAAGTIAGFLLVLNFFRDPERTLPPGDGLIVSPADGRIVEIRELFEEEFLNLPAIQVSIFMSPLDVHVNRFPTSGRVAYFKHMPGEHGVAYSGKSSDRNERTLIGIEKDGRRVLLKQIAGAVARRIVADVRVGQPAVIGARFGMIKFGSRVDVIVPKPSLLKISLHDRVVAGETVLATFA